MLQTYYEYELEVRKFKARIAELESKIHDRATCPQCGETLTTSPYTDLEFERDRLVARIAQLESNYATISAGRDEYAKRLDAANAQVAELEAALFDTDMGAALDRVESETSRADAAEASLSEANTRADAAERDRDLWKDMWVKDKNGREAAEKKLALCLSCDMYQTLANERDSLKARVAELEAQHDADTAHIAVLVRHEDAAYSKVEAANASFKSEVYAHGNTLRLLAAANARADAITRTWQDTVTACDQLKARVAELEARRVTGERGLAKYNAECERLRAELTSSRAKCDIYKRAAKARIAELESKIHDRATCPQCGETLTTSPYTDLEFERARLVARVAELEAEVKELDDELAREPEDGFVMYSDAAVKSDLEEKEALKARVKQLEKQWEEHCSYHGSESPHALNDALCRASDAESHCKALAEDRTALKSRVAELLSACGAEADVDAGRDPIEAVRAVRDQANRDADECVVLRARVAELEEQNEQRKTEYRELLGRADAAESSLADATAVAEHNAACADLWATRYTEAEARLAAATGLLNRWLRQHLAGTYNKPENHNVIVADTKTFIANQPSAPPGIRDFSASEYLFPQEPTAPSRDVPQCPLTRRPSDGGHCMGYRNGGYCMWCGEDANQPRTLSPEELVTVACTEADSFTDAQEQALQDLIENFAAEVHALKTGEVSAWVERKAAEQAVLDAMGAVSEWELRNGFWRHEPAGAAELARRGLTNAASAAPIVSELQKQLKTVRHWVEAWRNDEKHEDPEDYYMGHIDYALKGSKS